jgi:hypothetical protein
MDALLSPAAAGAHSPSIHHRCHHTGAGCDCATGRKGDPTSEVAALTEEQVRLVRVFRKHVLSGLPDPVLAELIVQTAPGLRR